MDILECLVVTATSCTYETAHNGISAAVIWPLLGPRGTLRERRIMYRRKDLKNSLDCCDLKHHNFCAATLKWRTNAPLSRVLGAATFWHTSVKRLTTQELRVRD